MRFWMLPLLLAGLLTVAATATAHAAPAPRDFETRVIHDHNDDARAELLATGGSGFDTIALDVREAYLPDGNPALVLRMILNEGCPDQDTLPVPCGGDTRTLTVQFQADGEDKEVVFESSDGGATWTGDPERFVGPLGINDGTRFAIEGFASFASLGIQEGSTLTGWFVRGESDGTEADSMPEGPVPGTPDPLGAAYQAESYTVGAPGIYLKATPDVTTLHGDGTITLRVENTMPLEQNVTFSVSAPAGVTATTPATLTLPANYTDTVTVPVTVPADASGDLIVSMASPLGGYANATVAVTGARSVAMDYPDGPVTSPGLEAGDTWSYVFDLPGAYRYHSHHTGDTGIVRVLPAQDGVVPLEHQVDFDDKGFHPDELEIHAGDTVTWKNNGSAAVLMVMGTYSADADADDTSMEGVDHDHDHGDTDDHDTPSVGPVALIGVFAVAAVVVARRR